ncbi:MAG: MotA/TolQ/ExbB proton channel family protein [Coriobacteriales bacterium]|jgi:biopolymer transport protein ExbB/TolQ|nr:MotA/TolQ/ExbB proton channel family protein [Coriobacteriales bacterium]
MGEGLFELYIKEIMHIWSQALLAPTIILLLALVIVSLFLIGSVIVEIFTERRHFKVKMPEFLNRLTDASAAETPEVIDGSGLLKRQKRALHTLFDNRGLPEDARTELAKRLLADEEMRFERIVGRTDLISRTAPMLGLMATLIPLGPGIIALGQGDTASLADSLLTAFDATVTGLLTAIVALGVSKLRKYWYEDYMISLEASANTILEKIQNLTESGSLDLSEAQARRASRHAEAKDSTQRGSLEPLAPLTSGKEASEGLGNG